MVLDKSPLTSIYFTTFEKKRKVRSPLPRQSNFLFLVYMYSRARKLFGHLNEQRCDFNINIIILKRKPPLSVSN